MRKLCIALVFLCSIFLCIGCSNKHQHTYDDFIAYESGHYHPYTCGCPQEEILEEHNDSDKNNTCDICGYIIELAFALPSELIEKLIWSIEQEMICYDVVEYFTFNKIDCLTSTSTLYYVQFDGNVYYYAFDDSTLRNNNIDIKSPYFDLTFFMFLL